MATLHKHLKNHERESTKARYDCNDLMGELLKESRVQECQESSELPLQLLESGEVEQEIEALVDIKQFKEEIVVATQEETEVFVMPVPLVPKPDKISKKRAQKTEKKVRPKMQCDICGLEMLFSEKNFVKHYRTKHLLKKKRQNTRHICKPCKRAFVTSADLVKHKRIHTKDRPFKCDICKCCKLFSFIFS